MTTYRSALVVLQDLMFRVKISEALKRSGIQSTFVSTKAEALAQARGGADLVIVDLNYAAVQPLDLITELKSGDSGKAAPILAYVSHVQTDLRKEAAMRGADWVVARSALEQTLAGLNTVTDLK